MFLKAQFAKGFTCVIADNPVAKSSFPVRHIRSLPTADYTCVTIFVMLAHNFYAQLLFFLIIIQVIRRVPVAREIINVYDVFNPWVHLLTFLLRAPPRTPLGRLQRPSDSHHIQNVTLMSDHRLTALPFHHLAINLSGGDIYAKTAA